MNTVLLFVQNVMMSILILAQNVLMELIYMILHVTLIVQMMRLTRMIAFKNVFQVALNMQKRVVVLFNAHLCISYTKKKGFVFKWDVH